MLMFLGLVAFGFLGIECLSILLHRFVFHGPFWKIHETHHVARKAIFELNDSFSVGFALISIVLLALGFFIPESAVCFPLGLGICVYGGLYFVVHDLMAHKRYYPLTPKNRIVKALVHAHRCHHRHADQVGQGPWGLFIYRYDLYRRRPTKSHSLNTMAFETEK
jgi:beta-carotene 3-hydroxylase